MYSLATLPGLVPAQAGSPSPSSQPSSGPEIVPGKEVPGLPGSTTTSPGAQHWSGLPLWGKAEAEKLGFQLPQPLGLSYTYYTQSEHFRMPELKLGYGERLLNARGLVRVPNIKIAESAQLVRLDAWLLPFFDVYGVAGYVSGDGDIAIEPAFLPPKSSPRFNLHLDYEGPTAGLGGTLGAGVKPFKARSTMIFALADVNVTATYLDFEQVVTSLQPVTVTVLNVRGGVRDRILRTSSLGDVYMSVWGGVMWEGVQEIMSGSVSILDLGFKGKIRSVDPWNTIIGFGLELGRHINVMLDFGFGQRKSLMLSATYRL